MYGLRGISKVIYLSDRTQFVSINQIHPDVLPITYGVPHGSVLRPILFNLYVNAIVNVSIKLKFILFADDTSVFFSGDASESEDIDVVVNQELQKLSN